MADRLGACMDVKIDEALVQELVARHERETTPRLEKLWRYYRNASEPVRVGVGGTASRLAQVSGLPARLKGGYDGYESLRDDRERALREIVIENDIAWRVQLMVDFMFGKPLRIYSGAGEELIRRDIERVLDLAWEGSGGISLMQDMALLGHVYGHVDLLLRVDEAVLRRASRITDADERLRIAASSFRIELVEPTRGIPIVDPCDYRRLLGYVVSVRVAVPGADRAGRGGTAHLREVFTPSGSVRSRDSDVVSRIDAGMFGDEIPIVHIQNIAQPMRYEGLGEVEPLIPLQDELNTRLSDRASRVTMQSFKMYLAKGIDGFEKAPIGPGRVWATDNMDASIEAFGGDASSPSEDAHIAQIRAAMDKQSGVPPIASGVVQAKIGNLSSANALRITLMGVLSKTARKRVTYGAGIKRICGLMLVALDASGVLRTADSERSIRLDWPDPLPDDLRERTQVAGQKLELGIPRERVLEELGYGDGDAGVG